MLGDRSQDRLCGNARYLVTGLGEARGRRPTQSAFCSNLTWVGQRNIDRWPKPTSTRHVWIAQPGLQVPPIQGFVVSWRRHSYRWSALVVWTVRREGHEITVQEWMPVERLMPVRSDPNDGRAVRGPW